MRNIKNKYRKVDYIIIKIKIKKIKRIWKVKIKKLNLKIFIQVGKKKMIELINVKEKIMKIIN